MLGYAATFRYRAQQRRAHTAVLTIWKLNRFNCSKKFRERAAQAAYMHARLCTLNALHNRIVRVSLIIKRVRSDNAIPINGRTPVFYILAFFRLIAKSNLRNWISRRLRWRENPVGFSIAFYTNSQRGHFKYSVY